MFFSAFCWSAPYVAVCWVSAAVCWMSQNAELTVWKQHAMSRIMADQWRDASTPCLCNSDPAHTLMLGQDRQHKPTHCSGSHACNRTAGLMQVLPDEL